jgi:hypothetical protein
MSLDQENTSVEDSVAHLNQTSIDPDRFPDQPRIPVLNQETHKEQLKKVVSQNEYSSLPIEANLLKMENVPTKQEIRELHQKPQ